MEVNTAELYSYVHDFQDKTGDDLTLEKYYKDLAEKLNDSRYKDFDIVQVMLSWVVEDCYSLFLASSEEEEDSDSELEDDEEDGFTFDCQQYRADIETNNVERNHEMSVGKQTWLERRKQQYEYYDSIETPKKESILKTKDIRPISYLKVYELLISGVGLKNKDERFSLEDFMTICFVGWMHDGKWEDGIRA